MKLFFILAVIVMLAGSLVGELMLQDPGYVLLTYQETTIETSIWGLVLIAIVLFVALHLSLQFLSYLLQRKSKIGEWNRNRGRDAALRKTLRGMTALTEGEWSKAQRSLSQSAAKSDFGLFNLLGAARAAHELNQPEACEELLARAARLEGNNDLAVGIAQAEIQLERGQLETALATLQRLRNLSPKHSYVLKLLKQTYLQLEDWKGLSNLLPDLRKQHIISPDDQAALERQAFLGLLEQTHNTLAVDSDSKVRTNTLVLTWSNLPKALANDSKLAERYVELLLENGATDQAEEFLRGKIKKHWDQDLVKLYGLIASSAPDRQLKTAQDWQRKHSNDATLLLTLGRLSLLNENWEQARQYFDQSLALEASQEAYNEQVRLLHYLKEDEACDALMRTQVNTLIADLPKLPMPEEEAASDVTPAESTDSATPVEKGQAASA